MGEFVDVKSWPAIDKPGKYAGKEAFFCSVTDPYQPLEKKYGRTPKSKALSTVSDQRL